VVVGVVAAVVVVVVVVVGAAAVVLMVPWTPPIVALKEVEVLVVEGRLSEYDRVPDWTAGNADPSPGKLSTSKVARRRCRIITTSLCQLTRIKDVPGSASFKAHPFA
jgi:hypothetical protein